MKNGDVIVDIKNRLIVTYLGWVAGEISTYEVRLDDGVEHYTGTKSDVLKYCSRKVEDHNKECKRTGGVLI